MFYVINVIFKLFSHFILETFLELQLYVQLNTHNLHSANGYCIY
jgi:hypothetical protein